MSSLVGYYRYKVVPKNEGASKVEVYVNGTLACTATVIAKKFCDGHKILKYLDSSGRYRFFPFNDKWQSKDKPTSKGKVNNFVTSILDSQSSQKELGYDNERTISLTAGNVSAEELEKLSDIYTSPRVYLYVGDGTNDRVQDWILVSVSGDGIGRRKNDLFGKVVIDITLPEYYAVAKI